jgi:hypothetical protein
MMPDTNGFSQQTAANTQHNSLSYLLEASFIEFAKRLAHLDRKSVVLAVSLCYETLSESAFLYFTKGEHIKAMFRYVFVVFSIFTFGSPSVSQWTQTNLTTTDVRSLLVSCINLFAGTYGGGVFLSTNDGTSWTQVNTGLTNTNVRSLAVKDANLFAGTWGGGVYLSTNNGTGWTQAIYGLTNPYVLSFAVTDTNLFAGIDGGGVFRTANSGTSWHQAGLLSYFVPALAVHVSGSLFAGTTRGIFRTDDIGNTWTPVNTGLTSTSVYSLAVNGTNLFAGTINGGAFLSTNNGTNWTQIGFVNITVWSFAVAGMNLFAGTSGGVYFSTNNGTSWTPVNAGLPNTNIRSLAVSGTNLFAGTSGVGVWRRPLSEMIVSVEPTPEEVPTQFSLSQNYPNPFNPTTTITYALSSQERDGVRLHVTLKVFDLLGRAVATLVNEPRPAGTHSVKFNAEHLPSGVYFYRLQAGAFHQTKKLVLLR